jgi:hypothetical protein
MIRLTVSSKHPVTIVAAGARRFHFARLISVSRNIMHVQLRKAVPPVAVLNATSAIIETLGGLSVQIDCRNVSTRRERLLTLEFQNPASLDIQITPNPEGNPFSDSRS